MHYASQCCIYRVVYILLSVHGSRLEDEIAHYVAVLYRAGAFQSEADSGCLQSFADYFFAIKMYVSTHVAVGNQTLVAFGVVAQLIDDTGELVAADASFAVHERKVLHRAVKEAEHIAILCDEVADVVACSVECAAEGFIAQSDGGEGGAAHEDVGFQLVVGTVIGAAPVVDQVSRLVEFGRVGDEEGSFFCARSAQARHFAAYGDGERTLGIFATVGGGPGAPNARVVERILRLHVGERRVDCHGFFVEQGRVVFRVVGVAIFDGEIAIWRGDGSISELVSPSVFVLVPI